MIAVLDPTGTVTEALKHWRSREIFTTDLSSAEILGFSRELRMRSVFSARTTNAEYLQEIAETVDGMLSGKFSMAEGRYRLFRKLRQLGYDPETGFPGDMADVPPAERGSLQDLSGDARIRLVLETNMRVAANYGRMVEGNREYALYAYPAWKLVRLYQRDTPRGTPDSHTAGWAARWRDAGEAVNWEGALRPESGNQKPESEDGKPESGDGKPESGNQKPESEESRAGRGHLSNFPSPISGFEILRPESGNQKPESEESRAGRGHLSNFPSPISGFEMIARKDSPIWQALGDGAGGYGDTLSNPFPPFAFNSGMAWEPVERARCLELGLIAPDETPEPMGGRLGPEEKETSRLADRLAPDLREELLRETAADEEGARLRKAAADFARSESQAAELRRKNLGAAREAHKKFVEGLLA